MSHESDPGPRERPENKERSEREDEEDHGLALAASAASWMKRSTGSRASRRARAPTPRPTTSRTTGRQKRVRVWSWCTCRASRRAALLHALRQSDTSPRGRSGGKPPAMAFATICRMKSSGVRSASGAMRSPHWPSASSRNSGSAREDDEDDISAGLPTPLAVVPRAPVDLVAERRLVQARELRHVADPMRKTARLNERRMFRVASSAPTQVLLFARVFSHVDPRKTLFSVVQRCGFQFLPSTVRT
jgi:hypothetical protein